MNYNGKKKTETLTSKWFCVCGYQNFSVLFGDECRECGKGKPRHKSGVQIDSETGEVSW